MKVLFMFSGLPHYYNLILSRLNNVENLEIVVVVPNKNSSNMIGAGVHQSLKGINFKVIYLDVYKAWYKFFFKDFHTTLKEEKPDIIVTIFNYAYSFLTNYRTKRIISKQGIKLIYKDIPFRRPYYKNAHEFHAKALGLKKEDNFFKQKGYTLISQIFTIISKQLYNRFDAMVNYIVEGKKLYGSYGVKEEDIFITYNSLDTEILKEIKKEVDSLPPILPKNPYRIFHIGRLVEWKRVDYIIKAVEQLKSKYPDIELLVIGNGPLLEDYKQMVIDLNIVNHVKFLGAIYDEKEKARYFNACSLYVLAGMGGLSINEAMSFGLPVLCSVCDGTEKHLVFENKNGKYFKDGDSHDFTIKLSELLSNTENLKPMGQYSLDIIKNQINVHTVINGYINAFNHVSTGKHLQYNIDHNLA